MEDSAAAKMAKAKRELEELYSGIPDDSVNLTFGDLAEVRQENNNGRGSIPQHPLERKNSPPLDPITEAAAAASPRKEEVLPLAKLPSLDFSRALEASAQYNNNHAYHSKQVSHHHHHHFMHYNHHNQLQNDGGGLDHHHYGHGETPHGHRHHATGSSHRESSNTHHHGMQNNNNTSMVYDDMSRMSGAFTERGGRRRPGIPHSNICTLCSNYIYIFRHRCLVCGRAYCRQCVRTGMGEMSEGRKCIECLGRRFSQRYIQRAGQIGCCMGYPSQVKQQEIKWAEKGPRGSGENRHGRSEMMMSRTISPSPRLPPSRGYNNHSINNTSSFVSNAHGHGQSSFVMGSPYFSPTNHPMPF